VTGLDVGEFGVIYIKLSLAVVIMRRHPLQARKGVNSRLNVYNYIIIKKRIGEILL